MAVQPVGITDRHGGRHRRTCQHARTAVAHRLGRCQMLDLNDTGTQRRDGTQPLVVLEPEAVKPQSQTA